MAFKYTRQVASHLFGSNYDPLSTDSTNWTALTAGSDLKATGGVAANKASAAASPTVYKFAGYTPGSANYRVHASIFITGASGSADWARVPIHMADASNLYELSIKNDGSNWALTLIRRKTGTPSTLQVFSTAIQAGTGNFSHTIDAEVTVVPNTSVSFSVRFDDPGDGSATEYAYTDSSSDKFEAAGYTGIKMTLTGNIAEGIVTIDNLYCYETAAPAAAYYQRAFEK